MIMAAPYSDDMRGKAIAAVRGERKTDVSQIFGISRLHARLVAQA